MSEVVSIPVGWHQTHLGDVCSKITDGTHDTPKPIESGKPYITAIHVKDGTIDFDNCYYLSEEDHAVIYKRCNPEYGDVLIVNIGAGTAAPARVKVDFEFSMKNVALLKPDKSKLSGYYLEQYQMHKKQRLFHQLTSGGAQPFLSLKQLGKLPITLPPLPEQKAIAGLLATWDEAIEKTERLIQAKEKQGRQMSRWLLFGHKRLGKQKNVLADGHFFKYPSDWGLVKIGKVAKEVSARNGESEETVLSCSKYDGFVNSLDYFGKQVFSSDTSSYKVVKKGQFGYPSNHVEEGSIGLLEHCEKGIVSPIYVVFEASKEKVHSPYLYKLLKTDIYRHIFQVSTRSSVDRRGSLRWGDFSKIKVLVPSLEEQQQISETLSSAQHEINLLRQLAGKYKTQKRGLMQKMLTGEWRVKPEIVSQYMEA